MTVCFKCNHLLRAQWRTRDWIRLGCGRQQVPLKLSPITGDLEPVEHGVTIKGKVYRWCKHVNQGQCVDYDEK